MDIQFLPEIVAGYVMNEPISYDQWIKNGKKLIEAVNCDNIKTAKELLELGQVNVNYKLIGRLTRFFLLEPLYDSALLIAVSNKNKDMVELLIKYNIDVNLQGKGLQGKNTLRGFSKTALILASKIGEKEIVELLLKNGADVDIKDNEDRTALDYALENNYHEIVELLKAKK